MACCGTVQEANAYDALGDLLCSTHCWMAAEPATYTICYRLVTSRQDTNGPMTYSSSSTADSADINTVTVWSMLGIHLGHWQA